MAKGDCASMRAELDGLYDGLMGLEANRLKVDDAYRHGHRRGQNARHSIRGTRLIVKEVPLDGENVVPIQPDPEGFETGPAA